MLLSSTQMARTITNSLQVPYHRSKTFGVDNVDGQLWCASQPEVHTLVLTLGYSYSGMRLESSSHVSRFSVVANAIYIGVTEIRYSVSRLSFNIPSSNY